MRTESSIRMLLSILEYKEKSDESIQHTHEYPHIKGQIEALKWVIEDLK
jgi:hypothetical protein